MKKVLIILLFLIIFIFVSCKSNKDNNEILNNKAHVNVNPNAIYHAKYTNVVKIQGKYVDMGNLSSYFTLGGREEGEYSGYYDIFDAIRNHSLQRVMEILRNDNSQINAVIEDSENEYNQFRDNSYGINGATPLILAVYHRDIGIAQYLLDNGADVEIRDEDGWNVFIYACAFGTVDIIKSLLNKYPDLVYSLTESSSANGLHIASSFGNIEVIPYLVNDLGIDINSLDDDGDGVLFYADNEETYELLESLGAE